MREEYPEMVVFVRHGESTGNLLSKEARAGQPVGTNFYNLTPRGEEQARLTGIWLRQNLPPPDKIFRSFYARARKTSELLYPSECGYSFDDDYRLAEVNRGVWHVMTEDEVREHYPADIRLRDRFGPYFYRPTNGENWPDVQERARSFRRTLRECHAGKSLIVCVTHAHLILLFQSINEHWSFEEITRRVEADEVAANASVLIYKRHRAPDGSWKLVEDRYVVPWKEKSETVVVSPA